MSECKNHRMEYVEPKFSNSEDERINNPYEYGYWFCPACNERVSLAHTDFKYNYEFWNEDN